MKKVQNLNFRPHLAVVLALSAILASCNNDDNSNKTQQIQAKKPGQSNSLQSTTPPLGQFNNCAVQVDLDHSNDDMDDHFTVAAEHITDTAGTQAFNLGCQVLNVTSGNLADLDLIN